MSAHSTSSGDKQKLGGRRTHAERDRSRYTCFRGHHFFLDVGTGQDTRVHPALHPEGRHEIEFRHQAVAGAVLRQGGHHLVPDPVVAPRLVTGVDALPEAEPLGQVRPLASGARLVEHRVKHQAAGNELVVRRLPHLDDRFGQRPRLVGQLSGHLAPGLLEPLGQRARQTELRFGHGPGDRDPHIKQTQHVVLVGRRHVSESGARHGGQRFQVPRPLGGGLGLLQPLGGLVTDVGELAWLLYNGSASSRDGRRRKPDLGVLLDHRRDGSVQVGDQVSSACGRLQALARSRSPLLRFL